MYEHPTADTQEISEVLENFVVNENSMERDRPGHKKERKHKKTCLQT